MEKMSHPTKEMLRNIVQVLMHSSHKIVTNT